MKISQHQIPFDQTISLKDYDPGSTGRYKNKQAAKAQLRKDIERISTLQYNLYAENRRSILIIFQAMDSAGKDSAIRHIMTGVNPQGCEVYSFKHPSAHELEHDFLWRHYIRLPDRGRIGIFNRSHYENVLITKVHPELLLAENLPGVFSLDDIPKGFWENRYRQINEFERTVSENGTTILKFFLHLSKNEQKKRFLARIRKPEKNWKFSYDDIRERTFWEDYQRVYEEALSRTSTSYAPWHIIPADHKWFSRIVIGAIIAETMEQMDLRLPTLTTKEKALLKKAEKTLMEESE